MPKAYGWLTITGICTAVLSGAGAFLVPEGDAAAVIHFFQQSLREPLFIGLLTVAAFLFSLQAFIVTTMKTHVYDSAKYEELLVTLRTLDPAIKKYGPLNNFSQLLFLSILLSLISAVTQFTIGLFCGVSAVAISVWTALWSLAMIFISLFYLQANLKKWFEYID